MLLLLFVPVAAAFWPGAQPSSPRPLSSRIKNLNFEIADEKSLSEVANFLVDAFFLASTTFDPLELTPGDKRQLAQELVDDLGPRYGLDGDKRPAMIGGTKGFPSKCLFGSRFILAREPGGAIVACAGVQAAFYDPSKGRVIKSNEADGLVRAELNELGEDERAKASEVYKESGIGALAKGIVGEKFNPLLKPFMKEITPCSLLADFAVSPSYRRSGLGRAMCDQCAECSADEWKIDEIALQVEEANKAAAELYRGDGYKQMFRTEDGVGLRLRPSAPSPFDILPGPLSALAPRKGKLLNSVPVPILTMSKKVP
jgi:GNAT superfamily N-acetyltransferase